MDKTIDKYCQDVLSGKIVAGNYMKLAVKRYLNLIDTKKERGLFFDKKKAQLSIDFVEKFIYHTKGTSGNFILSPYQKFTFWNLFGWHTSSGVRFYKTVYEKVARKNGKTAQLAALGLFHMIGDEDDSPEVYVGATKEDQARICWQQAVDFIKKSPELMQAGFSPYQREIKQTTNFGKFKFLGRDSDGVDGLNPSLSMIDEYHAHKDDSLREVLESAMGARQQPILYIITTAGFNVNGVCKASEDVYKSVLRGEKEEDSTLILIHEMDEGDDWTDEKNWKKANPNLGVSIGIDFLRNEYKKAINQPSKIVNFQTKHLNMWVDAPEVRVPDSDFMACSPKPLISNFIKHGCFGSYDLSATGDLTAISYTTNEYGDGIRDTITIHFTHENELIERARRDEVPYVAWKKDLLNNYVNGLEKDIPLLYVTSGKFVNFAEVFEVINYFSGILKPSGYYYDAYKAVDLNVHLEELGYKIYPFKQTAEIFGYPTEFWEKSIFERKINHGGNPILRWSNGGVVAQRNFSDCLKYVKKESTRRIDGIISTIMSLAGTLKSPQKISTSKYSKICDPKDIYI